MLEWKIYVANNNKPYMGLSVKCLMLLKTIFLFFFCFLDRAFSIMKTKK